MMYCNQVNFRGIKRFRFIGRFERILIIGNAISAASWITLLADAEERMKIIGMDPWNIELPHDITEQAKISFREVPKLSSKPIKQKGMQHWQKRRNQRKPF